MKRSRDPTPPASKQCATKEGAGRKYVRPKTQMVDAMDLPPPPMPERAKPKPPSRPVSNDLASASRIASAVSAQKFARPSGARCRPQATGTSGERAATPVHRFERLEHGVICGTIWADGEDGDGLDEEVVAMPSTFKTFEEYLNAMEPLLIEEAREGARSAFGEACEADRGRQVDIMSIQAIPGSNGWLSASVRFSCPLKGNAAPRDGSLYVLMDRQPPRTRDAAQWVCRQLMNSSGRMRRTEDLAEGREATQNSGAGRVTGNKGGGRGAGNGPGQQHDLAVAMAVIRGTKGFGDSHVIEQQMFIHPSPLKPNWVDPAQAMAAVGRRWWAVPASDLVTVRREIDALQSLKTCSISQEIFNPSSMAKRRAEEARQQLWPHEVAQEGYHHFLNDMYDFSQLKAIEESCAHLTHPDFGGVGPKDAPWLPFTLIQGPPGTGKTHTVRGILNTWHLVQYQRYYTSLVACLAPNSKIAREWRQAHGIASPNNEVQKIYSGRIGPDDLDHSLLYLPGVQPRPRVLVCAPSNAATDELLQRIMNDGFRAANGSIYRPNVVRIGSGDARLSDRARDVWVEAMVKQYLSAADTSSVAAKLEEKRREVALHLHMLRDRGHLAMQTDVEVDALAQELAQIYDAWYKARQEIVRLELVLSYMQDKRRGHIMDLELELVEHAEIIFTTLSSSGRNIFSRLKDRKYMQIETVLIDEACQACEVAALQPLMYGCRKCVLVGDPQQLPATVLSLKAKAREMERSLFERLQQGSCPVHMLMVQYRMHPEIRKFPSNHFYEGKLLDGDCILQRPDPSFYHHPLLKPYIFFDVKGKELRSGGKSVSNQQEADMAVALYIALLHVLEDFGASEPVSVGVITPYRDQRDCLQRTFKQVCGDRARDVFIETVDSFQGRQLDVVMLSCVRASATKSKVGFVGDIRRMNVAITRAQRACWILGDAATLRSSPTWQALMEDAEDRTRVIQNATARSLFPEQFGAGGGTGPHTMARHPSPRESLAPAAGPAGFSAGRGAPFPPPEDPRQHSMSAWGGGAPEASGWRQYPSAWGGPSGQQQLDGMALWGGGRGGGSSPFDSSPNSVLGGWRKGSF